MRARHQKSLILHKIRANIEPACEQVRIQIAPYQSNQRIQSGELTASSHETRNVRASNGRTGPSARHRKQLSALAGSTTNAHLADAIGRMLTHSNTGDTG